MSSDPTGHGNQGGRAVTWLVWLEDARDPEAVGGKGATLGRLMRAGFPVPRGFCLTVPAMDRLGDPAVIAGLDGAIARLGLPVAVRSSAVGEDGVVASFAGIHCTRLNVASSSQVVAALRAVRASAGSPAAVAYRVPRGLERTSAVATVVQRMVRADVSGVLFTRDPVTTEVRAAVEATWGLGDGIAAGVVTPDHFALAANGELLGVRIAEKRRAIVPARDGTIEVAVDSARSRAPCLDARQLRAVVALGRDCEALLGGPQDIEWAFAAGRLWLLQSRPITTSPLQMDDRHLHGSMQPVCSAMKNGSTAARKSGPTSATRTPVG